MIRGEIFKKGLIMKKFYSVFLSIILFVGCFTFFSLESHAEDFMYRYTVVNHYVSDGNPTSSYSYIQTKTIYSDMRIAWIPFYIAGNLGGYDAICSQSAYSSVNCSVHTVYGDGRETSSTESVSPYSHTSGDYHYYTLNDLQLKLTVPGYTVGWENAHTTGYCFGTLGAGLSYVFDGEIDYDDLEGDYGETSPPDVVINWGDGNGANGEDYENIPAPIIEVVYDANGDVKHSLRFKNTVYNSREHGVYGIVMQAEWASYDGFNIHYSPELLSNDIVVDYDTVLFGDVFDVYTRPTMESQIVRCPEYVNFDTNDASTSAFQSFLETFPIDGRTYTYPTADFVILNRFKNYLSNESCPYNFLIFSCYYYREMSDGSFHFGPVTTGAFSSPDSGAYLNINNDGSFTPSDKFGNPNGNGGGLSVNSPDQNSSWGPNSAGGLDTSNVDVSEVRQNLQNLFGFMGEMPQFVSQVFQFLPPWLIAFIAVAIALMVAIGIIKTLIG